MQRATSFRRFGLAWLTLCGILIVHNADEAINGFIPLFNRNAAAIAANHPGFPALALTLRSFVILTIVLVLVPLVLTPFAFQGRAWMRPLALIYAVIQIANAANHTVETILGHALPPVTFPRPAPGFYTSPLLVAGAVWLLVEWRKLPSLPFRTPKN